MNIHDKNAPAHVLKLSRFLWIEAPMAARSTAPLWDDRHISSSYDVIDKR